MALLLILLIYFLWPKGSQDSVVNATNSIQKANGSQAATPMLTVASGPSRLVSIDEKRRAQAQFEQASKSYCSYLESTKYPNYSRPIAQHADQTYPNLAITDSHPMRNAYGGADRSIMLHTSQSRVYLASNEAVRFSLKALDQNGKPQQLRVNAANARGLALGFESKAAPPMQTIAFSPSQDDNLSLYADLTPAASSFAHFEGTIRIDVQYQVNDKQGQVFFDVIYTPETPAMWTGKIRESKENGDLKFYVPVSIKTAGRYLASARLDDAKGKPVAYLSFNDLLKQSDTEIPFTVAGKLLRDSAVQFPVSLRDIDAYLLKENVDPDRQLLPRLEGVQHLSKVYALDSFSKEEWQSEERSRYLTEFGKDLQLARSALIATDPQLAQNPQLSNPCSLK